MQIRALCRFTNLRFTYHTESDLKIVFKKLQGITVDQYLNFNVRMLVLLMHYQVTIRLTYQQKKVLSTLHQRAIHLLSCYLGA